MSALTGTGALIINADDWGRDRTNTDRILACVMRGTVSSASAMVYMEDSERSAELAKEKGVDAGLHLNLTTAFTGGKVPHGLKEKQSRIARYLKRIPFAQAVYHPGLADTFKYVVSSQIEEFQRIYGELPKRVDGHHHMHLCANVLFSELLPAGTIARRNFSFQAGEKSFVNRFYRRVMDNKLAKRHHLTDYFFSLAPLQPAERLERICAHASKFIVEVETHPVNDDEFQFLMGEEVKRWTKHIPVASKFAMEPGSQTVCAARA